MEQQGLTVFNEDELLSNPPKGTTEPYESVARLIIGKDAGNDVYELRADGLPLRRPHTFIFVRKGAYAKVRAKIADRFPSVAVVSLPSSSDWLWRHMSSVHSGSGIGITAKLLAASDEAYLVLPLYVGKYAPAPAGMRWSGSSYRRHLSGMFTDRSMNDMLARSKCVDLILHGKFCDEALSRSRQLSAALKYVYDEQKLRASAETVLRSAADRIEEVA